ncbi:MAG: glycoside hydrolase N-terminal domain-containing protein [Lachnospiraceae bacterium]|nr:glycoside hydrolase N-terminal domain-containing protein [Lachnospiraceae bacterium]
MIKWKKIKRILAGLMAAAVLLTSRELSSISAGQVQAEEKQDTMVLWYETPADINTAESSGGKWMQESLPLGNGDLGNLIFGGIEKERIHFNEKSLWTGGPSSSRPNYQFGNTGTAYTAEEIESYRRILDDKSTNVFNDSMSGYGQGAAIRFPGADTNKGSYQDFGDIWVDYSAMGVTKETVSDYRRELNLHTGIASTKFTHQGTKYTREHFVSSPDQVMVTRLAASQKGKLNLSILMELNNGGLTEEFSIDGANGICTISGTVRDNGLKFRTSMKLLLTGGSVKAENNKLIIENADDVTLIMAAATDYKNEFPTYRDTQLNLETLINERINKAAEKSYEELKAAHLADHRGLFDRVAINLGEVDTKTPTNELVAKYREGEYSNYLDALSFQFGRYLTIAGSRGNLPSNLVGLWTVGGSAWTGDYHFNVNVQMNYWPVYVTNLAECGVTMVNYMDDLRAPGRLTAERIHGIENATTEHTGFTVHTENNPFGMTAPTNHQEYGWNPTGAAWAVQNIWAHYDFTRDLDYLKNKIYPIMKEAALFWDQYLWTSSYQRINDESSPYNGQGRLVVAPSFSEEQGPTAVGTTYDQSLVWELYKECVEAGKLVGESQELLDQWQENMQRLDPIEINATNGIKEWYEETRVGQVNGHNKSFAQAGNLAEIQVPNSGWNIGHPGEQRHASHLVGLYPGTIINKETPEYMEAAIVSLTERGEYSTGWSKANKINLWARTGNGEKAYRLLNNLVGGNTSGLQYNLFDSHGTGGGETMKNGSPIWQIDGNFGLTSGVAEMLLQSHMGYVEFLPAIPAAWSEGEVTGLKARGNFTIGQKWNNGVPEYFTVCYEGSGEGADFTGTYNGIAGARVTENGQEVTTEVQNGKLSFHTEKGKVYTIHMEGTNNDVLVGKAEAYLEKIPEALVKVKTELQEAITANSPSLGQLLNKAKLMVSMYESYLEETENIYYMTATEGLSLSEIDGMYNNLNTIYTAILENNLTLQEYENLKATLDNILKVFEKQMEGRRISFSRESGPVTENNAKVALNYSGRFYKIFYTTDGSTPTSASTEYTGEISLDSGTNMVLKAALFNGKQRVSQVYQKEYVAGLKFDTAETATQNWGDQYLASKMIDNDINSRWASKEGSGDIEILFTFQQERAINTIKFNQFVSARNSTDRFEIWAEKNGTMEKIHEGEKLGSGSDDIGGNRAYKEISFEKVATSKIKIVFKEGYQEPSFYEIQPLLVGEAQEEEINASSLTELLQKAEQADRNSDSYKKADKELIKSFEAAVQEAAASLNKSQEEINNIETFLRSRYLRLGFGETEKELLAEVISRAEALEKGKYTRSSVYLLEKALEVAKEVYEDLTAGQSEIDTAAGKLQKAVSTMEAVTAKEITVGISSLQGNEWITAGNYRATNSDQTPALTYQFRGNSIKVTTVKADDHGILSVTITDSENNIVYEELIDTYATERVEGVLLFEKNLLQGEYRISFVRRGVSANTTGQGWVEVGPLTITQPHEEVVDRSSLEKELEAAEAITGDNYPQELYEAFRQQIEQARQILLLEDEETCTAQMEDEAAKLAALRDELLNTLPEEVEYPDNMWVSGIRGDLSYTGSKVVQNLAVYDGNKKLTEKIDYTVTYKNNINAYEWNQQGDGIYVETLDEKSVPLSVLSSDETPVHMLSAELSAIEKNPEDEELPDNLSKSPQLTIKMKGNYKGSYTIYYEIKKPDIAQAQVDDLTVTYTGKNQTPTPVVTLNGKKLTMNKDFEVPEYLADKSAKNAFIGESDKDTSIPITIKGKGNYSGEKPITLTIGQKTESIQKISMSKVKVSGVKTLAWAEDLAKGEGMKQGTLTVKNGKDILVDLLTDSEKGEFSIEYQDNKKVGTATLILIGNGEDKDGDQLAYIGTKRITFKISGTSLNKAVIENLDKSGYAYTGEPVCPLETDSDIKVTLNKTELPKEVYTVDYQKNTERGTATIILTGVEEEGYTGVNKQTFKIKADSLEGLSSEGKERFKISVIDPAKEQGQGEEIIMPYTKGGVKPAIEVADASGKVLKEGIDYTVSYKNNKKPAGYQEGTKAPAIQVTGKGNYTGTQTKTFTIVPKDLSKAENSDDLTIIAADRVEKFSTNGWKSSFKVVDQDGKALTAKDMDLNNATYTIAQLPTGENNIENLSVLQGYKDSNKNLKEIPKEKLPAGTVIKITVQPLDKQDALYTGAPVTGTYRILKEGYDISKMTFKLRDQSYTGSEIFIDGNADFKSIKLKGKELTLSIEEGANQSLSVVPGSYVKNINKGTAKVTLQGEGEYGGTKTVSFKIVQKDVTNIWDGIFQMIFKNN